MGVYVISGVSADCLKWTLDVLQFLKLLKQLHILRQVAPAGLKEDFIHSDKCFLYHLNNFSAEKQPSETHRALYASLNPEPTGLMGTVVMCCAVSLY